ncbi:MAG: recombinase family protein, partial [Bacteroidetes bacterium]|nr:recombinase family protein [Bacteroidota bacterium]
DKFSQLMMGILSTMSDFERNLIRERQMEGIRIRKERGLYGGRKIGSKMDTTQFLQKEKSQKIIEYLKKGYTHNEISKILRCSPSTIQKVKGIVEGWNTNNYITSLVPFVLRDLKELNLYPIPNPT